MGQILTGGFRLLYITLVHTVFSMNTEKNHSFIVSDAAHASFYTAKLKHSNRGT